MRTIHLYVKGLQNEPTNFVKTISIPAFGILPDAVYWGTRTFFLSEYIEEDDQPIYVEGFMFICPYV